MLLMTSSVIIGNDSSLIFTGNMAKRGGAFAVMSSIVHIVMNANMTFLINSAQIVGGAMYFDPDLLQQQYYHDRGSQCFIASNQYIFRTEQPTNHILPTCGLLRILLHL